MKTTPFVKQRKTVYDKDFKIIYSIISSRTLIEKSIKILLSRFNCFSILNFHQSVVLLYVNIFRMFSLYKFQESSQINRKKLCLCFVIWNNNIFQLVGRSYTIHTRSEQLHSLSISLKSNYTPCRQKTTHENRRRSVSGHYPRNSDRKHIFLL